MRNTPPSRGVWGHAFKSGGRGGGGGATVPPAPPFPTPLFYQRKILVGDFRFELNSLNTYVGYLCHCRYIISTMHSSNIYTHVVMTKMLFSVVFLTQGCYCELVTNVVYDTFKLPR